MPNKENWRRNYQLERDDRAVKYAWKNTEFPDYQIVVVDLRKELGRYHPDYNPDERYSIDIEENGEIVYDEQYSTPSVAYNNATDLCEDYPDPREIGLEEDSVYRG